MSERKGVIGENSRTVFVRSPQSGTRNEPYSATNLPSVEASEKQIRWDPDWNCPHCAFVNFAIRWKCRNCGYDSNAGEFPYYNPLPPYQGLTRA